MKNYFWAIIAVVFVLAACANCGDAETARDGIHREQELAINIPEPTPEPDEPTEHDFPEPTPAPTMPPYLPPPEDFGFIIGEITEFAGRDWLVLDIDGRYALLLHETVIQGQQFHDVYIFCDDPTYRFRSEDITWAESAARKWLNENFFYRLPPESAALVRETFVENNDNPWTFPNWGRQERTPGGVATTDRIFLLSIDELVRYFGGGELLELGMDEENRDGQTDGLDYMRLWEDDEISSAKIAYNSEGRASAWWLRSPGGTPYSAAVVYPNGVLNIFGLDAYLANFPGFRPALWLNLESFLLYG